MRSSRRYQLRLADGPATELEAFAREHGIGLCAAIRILIEHGLEAESQSSTLLQAPRDSPAALAGLVAAEHAVLMVASVLPEGERRMHSLGQRAAEAAEKRLALFRDQAATSEEVC